MNFVKMESDKHNFLEFLHKKLSQKGRKGVSTTNMVDFLSKVGIHLRNE